MKLVKLYLMIVTEYEIKMDILEEIFLALIIRFEL